MFYPYPSDISVQEHVHFKPDFIMEANTMNPDLTAPFGSHLIWVHIFCNIVYLRTKADVEKQITKVVTGGKVVNVFQALFLAHQSRRLRVS